MPEDTGAKVTAIDHVGIAVTDLDEAIEFYQQTFGLVLTVTEVNEEQGVREAMLRAPGDDGTGTAIQLLAPLTPDSTIGKFIAKRGPGLQQLAYRVEDIDKASDAIRDKGMSLIFDKPGHGTENSRTQFVHPKSAGGVLVELVEPAATRNES
ncbi:methylmalonyl-CoA epimerase [Actinosynnema sp. ALI-1.44]|uniref:methylmalonyl-CoA epimerase n=1 Tax=Actinosynnema sp. ALI-1.44 TaxID=1933779 RepID=UPI00097BF4B4|nr:methylmalonyl-CoA epimerase [Actinosynnema sp. ALI-1.44]ONI85269.1 methylmalonyl-CoA epimerase [Actinosynnema sp. ALI-1.44]